MPPGLRKTNDNRTIICNENGELNEFKCYNIPYAILGAIIIWFGCWGFNGGSQFTLDDEVRSVIMNTIIAAAAGGMVDFLHCLNCHGSLNFNEKFLDGILGGLEGITVCFNVVSGLGALAVGPMRRSRSHLFIRFGPKEMAHRRCCWRDSRA